MKRPAVLLAWLAVPLFAAAGYFGRRAGVFSQGHNPTASAQAKGAETKDQGAGAIASWKKRLEKCSAAELPAVYAEIREIKDQTLYRIAMKLLCARWAEVDAPGGVAFFTKVNEDTKDSWGRSCVLAEWAVRDVEGAYEAVKALGKEAEGEMAGVGLELLHEDPQRFWLWFQKTRTPMPWDDDGGWQPVIDAHFDEMAAIAAEKMAEESKPGHPVRSSPLASGLYKMLAASLAEKDSAKAIEWAKSVPAGVRNHALLGILDVLATQQPEKVADYLAMLKDFQSGGDHYYDSGARRILNAAVGAMAEHDPMAALQWTVAHQAQLGSAYESYTALAGAFSTAMRDGRLTPEQAFNAVRALGKEASSIRSNVLRTMWAQLPAGQLAGAASWLKNVDSSDSATAGSNPSGPRAELPGFSGVSQSARSLAMAGVLESWERKDSAAAMAFADQLHDPSMTKSLYRSIVQEAALGVITTQSERFAAALARIPAAQRADVLYEQVSVNYGMPVQQRNAYFDGAGFAATLADVPASAAKDRAVTILADAWGASDPLSTLEWAAQQTDAGLKEKVAGAAVEAWAKQDAWGASEWIKEQPQGPDRDSAAHHLSRVLRTDEPQSAWTWASDIQDPATRLEAQSAVLRKWRDSSAADARAAVDALADSLTPAARQRLNDTLAGRDAVK